MTHDGESQAEPAELARDGAVGLSKALEQMRQEFGFDADAGVAHDDIDVRADALHTHLDAPALRRELHGV